MDSIENIKNLKDSNDSFENMNKKNKEHNVDVNDNINTVINNKSANKDNVENKKENNSKCQDKNCTTLYNQPNLQNIDDNIYDNDNDNNFNLKYEDKNYISLYNLSKQDKNDLIHDVNLCENEDNNDSEKGDKINTPLHNRPELKDNEAVNNVENANSFTLGEVRQAMNNGQLDDILPVGGPVYRTHSLKDTNNIEISYNNVDKSSEKHVKIFLNYINEICIAILFIFVLYSVTYLEFLREKGVFKIYLVLINFN